MFPMIRRRGSTGPVSHSVSLFVIGNADDFNHIVRQIRCTYNILTLVWCRTPGSTEPFHHPTPSEYRHSTVEAKSSMTSPFFDKKSGRPYYKRIFKVNVKPLGYWYCVKGENDSKDRWLVANYYWVCQDFKSVVHVFAEYDPNLEGDPKIDEFNKTTGGTVENVDNVMRYTANIVNTWYVNGGSGWMRCSRYPDGTITREPCDDLLANATIQYCR